ncbi:tRNA-specific 2-thiouridylase MnmA [Candidatus Desulfarcum epimagneticum]|uniref:tRNA-specific 2-thiouridylase MnmA n=1 Tax=uncultured Desulfobacteraceae bacterium TaxID=218296 RepID=A0A484HJC8_9BACT|nr:tRNA-specific 2-thiouridylase MnmA [uncultured Desulfobacteraceae bacterium]
MEEKIAAAVSGGIDSLVAAHLLKESGKRVVGVHFLTGYENPGTGPDDVRKAAARVGIEVEIADVRDAFKKNVVDYFVRTYQGGETPNPCMVCNAAIKFGAALFFARKLGADRLATGHYAGIERDESGALHIVKGQDPQKDQSYFLAFLGRDQIASACFPLAGMTKTEVRELAAKKGIEPVSKKESQDVCFIQGQSYARFLESLPGFVPRPGIIQDMQGRTLGRHGGLHLFTVGQRKGINCPAPAPYYVAELDPFKNRVRVGSRDDLLSDRRRVKDIVWAAGTPGGPFRASVKLRYRHDPVPATVYPKGADQAEAAFDRPQTAAPGQGAVFYDGNCLLGGGRLEKPPGRDRGRC